jgi:hypothetical protein
MLTREQEVVHRPEAIVGGGLLSRLRGDLRVRMDLSKREVSKHEPNPISKLALDLLDGPVCGSRIRALVVPILHERDRRVPRAASRVVAVQIDGDG